MKKGVLVLLPFVATTVFGQNWVKDGNGIPERVAINEFIVLNDELYDELYACGHFISEQFTSEARLYKSTNGGKNWNQVTMTGLEVKTMNAIIDYKGTLFTSGSLSINGAQQQYGVYCSHDDGATWEKNGSGIPERVAINEFIVLNNELYACGHFISEQFTSEARLYKSTNGGQSWEQVATPGLETLTANAIFEHKGLLFISGSLSQMGQKYGVFVMK